MRWSLWCALLLAGGSLCLAASFTFANPVLLEESREHYVLGKSISVFEDPNDDYSIEEVASPSSGIQFSRSQQKQPNYGFTKSAYWVRLDLHGYSSQTKDWLLVLDYPSIDYIDLFEVLPDGTWMLRSSGDRLPFNTRDVLYRKVVFPITVDSQQTKRLFMRFETQGSMQLGMTLWSPTAFAEKINNEVYVLGLYYGIMLAMIFYNFFLFWSVKDGSYLYYVLYIVILALVQMAANGLAFQYLWPNQPEWANDCIPILIFLSLSTAIRFSQSFLHTAVYTPLLNRILWGELSLGLLMTLTYPVWTYSASTFLGLLLGIVAAISMLASGLLCWRRGYRPALYFLVAWFLFLVGVIVYNLHSIGLVPTTFLTVYSAQIGSALEVILLSLGLADRINTLKKEKYLAQRKALDIQRQANEQLEDRVARRTQELAKKTDELEQQNTTLSASNRKLEDLNNTKKQLLKQLIMVEKKHLVQLKTINDTLSSAAPDEVKGLTQQASREIHHIDEILRPIHSLYLTEQAIRNKRVLLAETQLKQQILAKMALGGTGVELDIVSNLEEGRTTLEQKKYDIICVNAELIELTAMALDKNPQVRSVFMTSDDAPAYLHVLRKYPFLSNIVSRNETDRSFTLKNITTTVSKLLGEDLFGLEKYLNWGVEVRHHPIANSQERGSLLDKMGAYFSQLGVRRPILNKCTMVAEELLMNAIYDAPVNAEGTSLYNHLPRTQTVVLKPEEQGSFRYACDGMLLAISVEDPFGSFHRNTIIDYLERCYDGLIGTLNDSKGGAGRGLFHIIATSDLVVFNVKPGIRTEVIAMFNIDPNSPKNERTTSFHYFYHSDVTTPLSPVIHEKQ